jgi:predicted Zn finger-like uncharacterized protein
MYSQCPACLARFRVTAERLRAAHGRARCGRCGQAFDLMDRLSDELPASDVAAPATRETATPPLLTELAGTETGMPDAAIGVELTVGETDGREDYHFSAEDVEKVFIDARDWQRQYGTPAGVAGGGADLAVADPSQLVVDEPQGVEDITLEGLKVDIASETGESTHLEAEFDYAEEDEVTNDAVDDETREEENEPDFDLDLPSRLRTLDLVPDSAYADAADEARPATNDERGDLRAPSGGRRSEARTPPSADEELPDFGLAAGAAATRRPASTWLAVGSGLLMLALAVQLIHHFRQDIARDPQAGPALRRVYELFGRPLSPNWDLDAFEINQWGPTEDVAPGSALVVRAGLTNRAGHAQPYPLLRLEFEDRFGAAVAKRDFTPGEYLKSPSQAARQLAAGETTEAELSVVAPGTDAVGYRLDICLRQEAGGVRCAHGE